MQGDTWDVMAPLNMQSRRKRVALSIETEELTLADSSSLRFLVCGFGDARNVFTTIMDIHRQLVQNEEKHDGTPSGKTYTYTYTHTYT